MVQPSQSDRGQDPQQVAASARDRALPRGTRLEGVYRVEEPLGGGAGGSVYRVVHEELDRAFAAKVLDDEDDTDGAWRLVQEARTASAIRHEHIVDVMHLGRRDNGLPFVVMELLEGEDLRARLARRSPDGVPLDEARTLVAQMLAGLAAAHEAGVVHRDVKPANIFLARRRGETCVKLVDFGMSRHLQGHVGVTRTGQLVGTPLYMSPEQCAGEAVDARSDVYSLGVVAYELLAGRVPFEAETLYECVLSHALKQPEPLASLRAEVPPAVAAFVHRCLEKEPVERFSDAGEAAVAWEAAWQPGAVAEPAPASVGTTALEAAPPIAASSADVPPSPALPSGSAPSPSPSPSPSRETPRSRRWYAALALGLLATLAAFAWSARERAPDGEPRLAEMRDASRAPRSVPLPPAATAAAPATVQAPPAQAATAAVLRTVTSDPPGADVETADGRPLGRAPLEVDVGAGPVALRLSAPGYAAVEVEVSRVSPASLGVTLRRAPAPRRTPRASGPLPTLAPR